MNRIELNRLIMYGLTEDVDDELEEENTTSGGESYNIPGAFASGSDAPDNERTQMGDRISGFPNKADIRLKNFESKILDGWERKIQELSFPDFDASASASGIPELNSAFFEINRLLNEIDRIIRHTSKLRDKKNLTSNMFNKASLKRLEKVERKIDVIKIKLKNFAY